MIFKFKDAEVSHTFPDIPLSQSRADPVSPVLETHQSHFEKCQAHYIGNRRFPVLHTCMGEPGLELRALTPTNPASHRVTIFPIMPT